MSMDPGMMQQMLAMGLQGNGQGASVGGQQPQTNALGAGAQLVQKLMLMKALQQQQRPPVPGAPPQVQGPPPQLQPPAQPVPPMPQPGAPSV